MAFIRQSKFRHVFGSEPKKENIYENFRVTNCAFEGTFIAANSKFIAFCVEVGGGGAFCVIPVEKTGRLDPDTPKINGHREYVLDLAWNPFNDDMLATCSEDGSIKIWQFDKGAPLTSWESKDAALSLEYHERRCIQVVWHPIAGNVLMSVSQEPKICIWNLDEGTCEVEIQDFKTIIYSAAWSSKGDKIVTVCKDKKFRIHDARTCQLIAEGMGHDGAKPQRVLFTFDDTFLFSCGFSRQSDRQYAAWEIKGNEIVKLAEEELDTANGVLLPFYDSATQMCYLAAKGDSVVRYYELDKEAPYFHYITTYQSSKPQRSIGCIFKRDVDVNLNEVMRFYKLCNINNKGAIIPISFVVPRKSELFQDDLYPLAVSKDAAQEADAWFQGNNVEPNRVDMVTFFKGKSKPKPGGSGGLKKGLKGLKAKKDAKEAAKKEAEPTSTPAPSTSENTAKPPTPEPVEPAKSKTTSTTASAPGADPKVVEDLKREVKTLQDNQKKMEKEVKSLKDKLNDYDKLTNDIKLLCNAAKKIDERVGALEALVQEESETEDA